MDAMKSNTDIHNPQKMNPTDFGDSLTFPYTWPWGWYFDFFMKYLNNQGMEFGSDIHGTQRMNHSNFTPE